MSVPRSIFKLRVWRHLRALSVVPWHHTCNAPKSMHSHYYGLKGPLWRYFRTKSPLQWSSIRRSRVVFRHKAPVCRKWTKFDLCRPNKKYSSHGHDVMTPAQFHHRKLAGRSHILQKQSFLPLTFLIHDLQLHICIKHEKVYNAWYDILEHCFPRCERSL